MAPNSSSRPTRSAVPTRLTVTGTETLTASAHTDRYVKLVFPKPGVDYPEPLDMRVLRQTLPPEDLPVLRWSCDLALWKIQDALAGVLSNLPNRMAASLVRALIFPFGVQLRSPVDDLGSDVARSMLEDGQLRQRLTRDIFLPNAEEEGLGQLEAALGVVVAAREAQKKMREAVGTGKLEREPAHSLAERAVATGIISADEGIRLKLAAKAQDAVIQVDAFAAERYAGLKG